MCSAGARDHGEEALTLYTINNARIQGVGQGTAAAIETGKLADLRCCRGHHHGAGGRDPRHQALMTVVAGSGLPHGI